MVEVELESQYQRIIKGEVVYQFKALGLSLLFSRLQKMYMTNQTKEQMQKCLEDVNAFTQKYARIIEDDLKLITK